MIFILLFFSIIKAQTLYSLWKNIHDPIQRENVCKILRLVDCNYEKLQKLAELKDYQSNLFFILRIAGDSADSAHV